MRAVEAERPADPLLFLERQLHASARSHDSEITPPILEPEDFYLIRILQFLIPCLDT